MSLRDFPDRVHIHPAGPSQRDPSGGRLDTTLDPIADVPCSLQEAQEQEVMPDGSLGVKIMTRAYFASDPGNLAVNTVLEVASLGGSTPIKPSRLLLKRLVRKNNAGLWVHRADCEGRF